MRTIYEDLSRFFSVYKIERKVNALRILKYSLHPRFNCIFNYRLACFLRSKRIPIFPRLLLLLNQLLYGIEFSMDTKIGGGLFIPHTFGIVIGADKIGRNATIYQNVTLGAKILDVPFNKDNRPIVGDNVTLASGAVVVGRVTVGHHVVVAANSVVVHSIPDSVLAAGAPAKVIKEIK